MGQILNPPSRTVQPDSQSVVGAEAPGRLHLTELPPQPAVFSVHRRLALAHYGYVLGTRPC
eukprot:8505091-Pyramimonas_sp.AAC.3